MEIRANYTLIGAFTLVVLLGAVGFILWAAKVDKGTHMVQYEVYLGETVSGLSLNSDVLFCGVRVGAVTKITLSESTPGAVKVLMSISSDTPVREDSYATLENKGLTGVMLISISGGTAGSKLNRPAPEQVGLIRYQPSPLATVMANVPSTVELTTQLLNQLNKVLSSDNQKAISETLQSLAKVSSTLAGRAETLDALLKNAEKTTRQLELLAGNMNGILGSSQAAQPGSLAHAVKSLDATLVALEPGAKQFSKEGLGDLKMLIVESRNLVHVLTRIGQKLESDPRRFFFGETVKEFKTP